jgi:hypothetical protein
MKTKRQQQKTPTTKKLDLDLDAFLYCVTCFPNKDIDKQFNFNLGDTVDIMFSLNEILNFDPIIYFKSCISPCTNGTILHITFKFMAGLNM